MRVCQYHRSERCASVDGKILSRRSSTEEGTLDDEVSAEKGGLGYQPECRVDRRGSDWRRKQKLSGVSEVVDLFQVVDDDRS